MNATWLDLKKGRFAAVQELFLLLNSVAAAKKHLYKGNKSDDEKSLKAERHEMSISIYSSK